MKSAVPVLLVLCLGLGTAYGYIRGATSPSDSPAQLFRRCKTSDESPTYVRCLRSSALAKSIASLGMRKTVTQLKSAAYKDHAAPQVAYRSCQSAAFVAGQYAIETGTPISTILSQCAGECGGGCIRGAVREWMQVQDADGNAGMSLCNDANEHVSEFTRDLCRRGVGHGVAQRMRYDLGQSVVSCSRLAFEPGRDACVNGVLSEIYDAPGRDHDAVHTKEDPVSWCRTLPLPAQDSCFASAGVRVYIQNGDPGAASDTCNQVPEYSRIPCMRQLDEVSHEF